MRAEEERSQFDELAKWQQTMGLRVARRLLGKKQYAWIDAEDVVGDAVERVLAKLNDGAAQIDDVGKYANMAVRLGVFDLQKRSSSRHERLFTGSEADALQRSGLAGVEPIRDRSVWASGAPTLTVLANEARERISVWLSSRPTRNKNAMLGSPVDMASVLLAVLLFQECPLTPRFWPAGFPEIEDAVDSDELHWLAALWLADRENFPPVAADKIEANRLQHRRKEVQKRLSVAVRSLGLFQTDELADR